jgi:predicted nucleic acid-binding Zn ribbon protein
MTGIFSDKIPQHRHCEKCGKAFVGEGHFCSDECNESAGNTAKKKLRKLMLVWMALIVITIGAIAFIGL